MISCQRHLFSIPEGVSYLNCAYMSPLMHAVVEAGKAGVERKARPWEIRSADFFNQTDDLRAVAAKFFHSSPNDIAIVPSASYGLSLAAANVPVRRGEKILVLAEQFPSNLYPWWRLAAEKEAEIVTAPWPEDGDWTTTVLNELKEGVALAALPHTQWTSGGMLDLERIGEACRRLGTAMALDLTQSLGAYPFDVRKVQPDFAVAACYKWLLGPYTTGVLYVAPKWHEGRPLEENWICRDNARDFSGLITYTDGYQEGARRFDMGERSNFALLPATICAMEQLLAWGVEEVSETLGALNRRLVEGAAELGFSAAPEKFRSLHYLCLRSSDGPPKGLMAELRKEHVYVSVRGSSIRVTPHLYNSEQDIDHLLAVLRRTV